MISQFRNIFPTLLERPRARRYLGLVGVPTLLVALYLSLWATDGYVSRAQVMVEQDTSSMAAAAEMTLGILSIGGQRSKTDALIVETFMRSRTMLEYLDEALKLKEHFSSSGVDFFSRLSKSASNEEFLEYYQDRLVTKVHDDTYVLNVEFVAYDAEYARTVSEFVVKRAEDFVNEISRQLANEQLTFISGEVDRAHERLKRASQELIGLQREYEIFSPEGETQASGTILVALMQELVKARTEYGALLSYLNPNAPEVAAARARISTLEKQIATERGKQVGGQSKGLNDVMLAYQDAQVNLTLATEIYKTALATLETTRLESARKAKYLVSLSKPSLPDSVERPRVLYWSLTFFVLLNLAYFVMSLIVATVQDHRE